jgi:hypothetical protein
LIEIQLCFSDGGVLITVLPQPENNSDEVSDSEDEEMDEPDKKNSSGLLGGCCVM